MIFKIIGILFLLFIIVFILCACKLASISDQYIEGEYDE